MTEWIKCSNKKPEHNQIVICNGNRTYCCEEDMNKSWYHVARYDNKPCTWDINMNVLEYNDTFYIEDVEPHDHVENVTHWTELPEPPSEDSQPVHAACLALYASNSRHVEPSLAHDANAQYHLDP